MKNNTSSFRKLKTEYQNGIIAYMNKAKKKINYNNSQIGKQDVKKLPLQTLANLYGKLVVKA